MSFSGAVEGCHLAWSYYWAACSPLVCHGHFSFKFVYKLLIRHLSSAYYCVNDRPTVKSIRWVTWHRRQSTYWPTDPVRETSVGQVSTKFTWKLTLNGGGADEIESFCIFTAPSSATSALEEMTRDKSSFGGGCCSSCCTKWLAFTSGR